MALGGQAECRYRISLEVDVYVVPCLYTWSHLKHQTRPFVETIAWTPVVI